MADKVTLDEVKAVNDEIKNMIGTEIATQLSALKTDIMSAMASSGTKVPVSTQVINGTSTRYSEPFTAIDANGSGYVDFILRSDNLIATFFVEVDGIVIIDHATMGDTGFIRDTDSEDVYIAKHCIRFNKSIKIIVRGYSTTVPIQIQGITYFEK